MHSEFQSCPFPPATFNASHYEVPANWKGVAVIHCSLWLCFYLQQDLMQSNLSAVFSDHIFNFQRTFSNYIFFSVDLNKKWHQLFQRAFHFGFHHAVFWIISTSYAKVNCWRLSYSMLAVLPLKSVSLTSDSLSTFILQCVQQLTVASIYVKQSQMFFMAYFSRELSLLETLHVMSVYLTFFLSYWVFTRFILVTVTTSWLIHVVCCTISIQTHVPHLQHLCRASLLN